MPIDYLADKFWKMFIFQNDIDVINICILKSPFFKYFRFFSIFLILFSIFLDLYLQMLVNLIRRDCFIFKKILNLNVDICCKASKTAKKSVFSITELFYINITLQHLISYLLLFAIIFQHKFD